MGRREAHISRFIEGFTTGLLRPAFIDPLGRERIFNHRARPARLRNSTRNSLSGSPPLNLKCALPINLREFLAGQFAAPFADGLRIDEDGVFTLGPGAGEEAFSRVARAIRRYSTERAHERWNECTTALARLGDDLGRAAESGGQVVLCLGCAAMETGADAVGRHRGAGCIAVELSARPNLHAGNFNDGNLNDQTAARVEESRGLPEMLLRVIEGFRLGRAALGLCHYDLDCYVARGQVIFTWRPVAPA
ncbi:MAG: hypothetical protein WBE69_20605 [Candidatus Binataceae bacterium]